MLGRGWLRGVVWVLGLALGPASAQSPELVLQTGHADRVNALAFSPDGRWVASAGGDQALLLWDVATGKTLRRLAGATASITGLAFNANGTRLATCDLDGTVRLWDVGEGRCLAVLRRPEGGGLLGAHAVAFVPDGKEVLCAQDDGAVDVWEVASGTRRAVWTGHVGGVACLAVSPEGTWVATGGLDNQVLLRDLVTGQELRRLQGHEVVMDRWVLEPGAARRSRGGVFALAVSRDGSRIASGGWDRTVRLWDPGTGRLLKTLRGHGGTVGTVAFSPDGRRLVSGASDGVRLWNLRGGTAVDLVDSAPSAIAAAFSPDGTLLATGGSDQAVRLWDAASGTPIAAWAGQVRPVGALGFSPDGHTLAAVVGGTTLRRWDLATVQQLPTLTGSEGDLTAFAFTPDGNRLVTAAFDGVLTLWDLAEGRALVSRKAHELPAQGVACAPDGRTLVSGSWDRTVRFWDATSLIERDRWEDARHGVESVAVSPDGSRVATTEVTGPARVRRMDTGEGLALQGERGPAFLAFSPDGRWLAGPVGELVQIWDPATGAVARTLEGHASQVKALAFSVQGPLLATGGYDQDIRLWDPETGALVKVLRGHDHWVRSLAFNAAGTRLASASEDGRILVWDVARGEVLATVVAVGAEAYLIATPDGAYTATRAASAGVGFRLGDRALPFEQFDLRLNRPDRVLEALGLAPPETLRAAREAQERRLRRLGVDARTFAPGYPLPQLALVGPRPARNTGQATLTLRLRATDARATLDHLQVRVNGVPLYGTLGLKAPPGSPHAWNPVVSLPLGRGRNRVQATVTNTQGVESVAQVWEIHREAPPRKPDLYVVALGVSAYQDARYTLTYAAKDAGDVTAAFARGTKVYGRIHDLCLRDGEVTAKALDRVRAWLARADVDDVALVFLAGHGLLDARQTYRFAPSDMDFRHPEKGISYGDLEALLSACPARRKVLLMDTCHAGEVDGELSALGSSSPGPRLVARAFRGVALEDMPSGAPRALDLLAELFADLRQGNGAVVIAASGGLEFSMEGDAWRNGVFTYALLEALRDRRADADQDGRITVAELRAFVLARVVALTRGRQRPSVRQEPLDADFAVH